MLQVGWSRELGSDVILVARAGYRAWRSGLQSCNAGVCKWMAGNRPTIRGVASTKVGTLMPSAAKRDVCKDLATGNKTAGGHEEGAFTLEEEKRKKESHLFAGFNVVAWGAGHEGSSVVKRPCVLGWSWSSGLGCSRCTGRLLSLGTS